MSSQETLLNNRYRLTSQQCSGGMAVIYKAVDLRLKRTVAIKILRPSLITDRSFLDRFSNEAQNVARLTHPNIVTVHDVGQDGNTHYIVMEFVDGQDLKKVIRAEAPFSIEKSLDIAIKICAGIGYAHRSGLIHADVKPQNVLVAEGDIIKVTDFGIAQALSDAAVGERQKIVWGSPHYFSPEQAQGERPSPAADVYSIGIVLFEMLTGRLPYIGADQQELALAHIREPIPAASDFNPAVPPALDQIINKVMSKEPASRYRTADQLGRILISYLKQGYKSTNDMVEPVSVATNQAPTSAAGYPAASSPQTLQHQPAVQAPQSIQPIPSAYQDPTPPPQYARPADGYTPPPSYMAERQTNNTVTIVLFIIAVIAAIGLIPLWLSVIAAYG